jgi:two-component system phosphate regulon sensor histidine kinase PhoR
MHLRWYLKLVLAFLLVIAVVVIPSILFLGANQKAYLMSQQEESLRRELKLAGQMLADSLAGQQSDFSRIKALANQVGLNLQRRVTIISKDGRVLGDSGLSPDAVDRVDDHSHRPEILAARSKGFGQSIRFSTTMQANTLYGAIPIKEKENLIGFVRLAIPLSQIEAAISSLRWNLILTGLLTGILALMLSLFMTWTIGRPLRDITDMVKGMAEGDLKQPFHLLPQSDYSTLVSSLERMAEELRTKIELLETETGQMRTLLSTMREGVLVTDEKGQIILMNPFLNEVLGGRSSWKRRTILEAFMNAEFQDAVDAVLKTEPFKGLEISCCREPMRHFEVQVVALTSSHRPRRAVALLHDITELRYLLKVRHDFVANASHELRTPLTSISGYVETLLSIAPNDPPEIQKFLKIIQKNVNRMTLLVSELLDLAKLDLQEASKIQLDRIRLKEFLEDTVLALGDLAREKGLALSLRLEDLPEDQVVYWDRDRIQQALFNVLDNAVKYTPENRKIGVTVKPLPGLGNQAFQTFIEIAVEDNGIGIPREDLPRIFERFYRVDKNRSRELGGTGLGLSIVKHIVESHGGTVHVQSTLGQGSTFFLRLPVNQPIQRISNTSAAS